MQNHVKDSSGHLGCHQILEMKEQNQSLKAESSTGHLPLFLKPFTAMATVEALPYLSRRSDLILNGISLCPMFVHQNFLAVLLK